MRIVRGRAETPEADLAVTGDLLEYTSDTAAPALRVWRPHRMLAFGRRDANRDGYDEACHIAAEHGYVPVERTVGGHGVAYTGNTVAFVRSEPVGESRTGIQERYEEATATLVTALEQLGVDAQTGEPASAFCPGTHSLSATGKIAGLAQRIRRDVALVSGVIVVCDHEAIADVLDPVYATLDVPFDPDTVGSIARAGGEGTPEAVVETVERALTTEY